MYYINTIKKKKKNAIQFALMAKVLIVLSLFFINKNIMIAFLLFFIGTLIAIVDFYTVKYLIQMKKENCSDFYENNPERMYNRIAKKVEALFKCRL